MSYHQKKKVRVPLKHILYYEKKNPKPSISKSFIFSTYSFLSPKPMTDCRPDLGLQKNWQARLRPYKA